jgi:hypothetical protein
VPALVLQEVFDRVQARLAETSRRDKKPPVQHLLRGMIECGECGSPMDCSNSECHNGHGSPAAWPAGH